MCSMFYSDESPYGISVITSTQGSRILGLRIRDCVHMRSVMYIWIRDVIRRVSALTKAYLLSTINTVQTLHELRQFSNSQTYSSRALTSLE